MKWYIIAVLSALVIAALVVWGTFLLLGHLLKQEDEHGEE